MQRGLARRCAGIGASVSRRCQTGQGAVVAPALPASTARGFTNLFSGLTGGGKGSTEPKAKSDSLDEDPIASALKINVADLANGDDMPPMLQYNDNLVDAALTLLEFANTRETPERHDDSGLVPSEADHVAVDEQVEAVSGIVAMLFNPAFVSPYQQYLAVARLLDIPEARKNAAVVDAAHSVYRAIMPSTLAQLVIAVDTHTSFEESTLAQRDHVHGLIEAIIDHGGTDAGDTKRDPDEVLLTALKNLEMGFPEIFNDSNFISVLQDMNTICLQARFSYLVNETCLAFDPERTGRVKLAELKEALEKMMPKYAADRMIAGCEADDDGTVYYPQMAAILMRGDGPVSPEAAAAHKPASPSA